MISSITQCQLLKMYKIHLKLFKLIFHSLSALWMTKSLLSQLVTCPFVEDNFCNMIKICKEYLQVVIMLYEIK